MMTSFQKRLLVLLSVVVGLTRPLAWARSLFDWDEALFCLGVREYDVAVQHPHPPGYPLFIAAGKVVHALGLPEFRSLQTVVLLCALLIFPALVWLARELGLDYATAVCGALLFSFFPNVWVYSGTAFSDVPGALLTIVACALLLEGRRNSRAFLLGAIALGVACGVRPAGILVGIVPGVWATVCRLRARAFGVVAAACVAGALVIAASYGGAILASSSFEGFVEKVRQQQEWVRTVDSYHNPLRAPLPKVARIFFLHPFDNRPIAGVVGSLALLSIAAAILRRRWCPIAALALFLPLAIFSWLNLDVDAAGRYAIGFMPAHALLAADGALVLGGLSFRARRERARSVQVAFSTAIVLALGIWTWPALTEQRRHDSPPVAAMQWLRHHVAPRTTLFVHGAYEPHASFLLPDYDVRWFESPDEVSLLATNAWVLDWRTTGSGINFVRPRRPLWDILRRRNFETSVSRAISVVRFGDGWYGPEGEGADSFRWMARESQATLPALDGSGKLSVRFLAPLDALRAPMIEFYVNGRLLERVVPKEAVIARSWVVPSRRGAPNELRIASSETFKPSAGGRSLDDRDLSVRMDWLSWTPVR
jgi:hypothetical protein